MPTISAIAKDDNAVWYTVKTSPSILKYTIEKGSIAMDGISLTVAKVDTESFSVSIIDSSKQTTELINKISNATNEQASSINEVTQGVNQISAVVQTNSATSEESAASSEELNSQAKNLSDLVQHFKVSAAKQTIAM